MSANRLRFARQFGSMVLWFAAAGTSAHATVTLDTTPSWNGTSAFSCYGGGGCTATYGETLVAPANQLDSFTFYLKDSVGRTYMQRAFVFAWSGSLFGGNAPQGATGAPLYIIDAMPYTGDGSFQAITINTGGVPLSTGGHYVIGLTTSFPGDNPTASGITTWGDVGTHVANDGGGGWAFFNNNTFADLNSMSWDDFIDAGDLAFQASFTTAIVPEPGSALVLGAGLLGFGATRRRSAAQPLPVTASPGNTAAD